MRRSLLLALLALPMLAHAQAAWYSSAWPYRKALTIDHTLVAGDLSNFPVLVRLAGDADVTPRRQYTAADVLFTASDGVTQLNHEIVNSDPLVVDQAFWTNACTPRAVQAGGKTYLTWQNTAGDIVIGQYVHATQTWSTFTLHAALTPDHHNNGAIHIRADGRLLVGYSQHNEDAVLRQRISTNAGDISAWGAETTTTETLPVTYTHYRYLSGESTGTLYHFYRVVDTGTSPATDTWRFRTSTDGGSTWSAATSFWSGGATTHNYALPATVHTATRLHFAGANNNVATWALDESTGRPGVYHFYLDVSSGSRKWYMSDGTEITTSLPHGTGDATLVHDPTTDVGFPLEATIDGSGNPLIAYTVYPGAPAAWAHQQTVARWTGSAWSAALVVDAGGPVAVLDSYSPSSEQPQDAAGIAFDPADANTVYVGVEQGTNTWAVERYTWTGSAWSLAETLSHRTGKHRYLTPVLDAHPDLTLLWLNGYYEFYAENGSGVLLVEPGIWGYPRGIVTPSHLLVANVLVPSVSSSVDTTLYLYWGNNQPTDQSNPTAVWDSNYLAVWHGRDCPDDNTLICDSTSNARHIQKPDEQLLTAPHEYAGKTARGQRFGHNTANDHGSVTLNLASKSQVHVQGWLYYTTLAASDNQVLVDSLDASGVTEASIHVRITPNNADTIGALVIREADTNASLTSNLAADRPAWNWIESLFVSTVGLQTAHNTVKSSSTVTTGNNAGMDATASPTLYVGKRGASDTGYLVGDAILENLRISDVVRSDDWRATEYANYDDPAAFISVATVETVPRVPQRTRGIFGGR